MKQKDIKNAFVFLPKLNTRVTCFLEQYLTFIFFQGLYDSTQLSLRQYSEQIR